MTIIRNTDDNLTQETTATRDDRMTGCVLSAAWCRKCGEGRISVAASAQTQWSGWRISFAHHHLDLVLCSTVYCTVLYCTVLYSGQDGGYPHHLDLDTIIFIWSYGRASTSVFRPPTSAAPGDCRAANDPSIFMITEKASTRASSG